MSSSYQNGGQQQRHKNEEQAALVEKESGGMSGVIPSQAKPKLPEQTALIDNKDGPAAPQPPAPKFRPMSQLDRRRRRNMRIAMTLVAIFVCGTIGLFAWVLHRHANDPDFFDAGLLAKRAQDKLNQHLNTQQVKTIKQGCEATILIMRHCEKTGINIVDKDGNQHCSYLGMERAHFIPSLFGSTPPPAGTARWPNPSYLFALSVERDSHLNFREYETLEPLSKKINVDIEITKPHDLAPQIRGLLQSGEMCGKMAIVSWKHEYIALLGPALGCGPEEGCPAYYPEASFDQVWQIKFVFRPPGFYFKDDEDTISSNIGSDDDDEVDSTTNSTGIRRQGRNLKKKKKRMHVESGWQVYGTVSHQNFDPLAVSHAAGDYPDGGVSSGGRWNDEL